MHKAIPIWDAIRAIHFDSPRPENPHFCGFELDRRGAELLFQVLTEREEKNSVAIASNESFSGWTKTFTDPRLCAAIVDRLTFNGTIIETGTHSYRLAHARANVVV